MHDYLSMQHIVQLCTARAHWLSKFEVFLLFMEERMLCFFLQIWNKQLEKSMVPELEQLTVGFVMVLNFLIYELDCKIFMDNLIASLNKWML
jgi:hypothetical protein